MASFKPPDVFSDAVDSSTGLKIDISSPSNVQTEAGVDGMNIDQGSPVKDSADHAFFDNHDKTTDNMSLTTDDNDMYTANESDGDKRQDVTQDSYNSHSNAQSFPGMYLILDLISEEGSGGLVDKVIIAQESLREFVNELSPGAYVSETKVDFRALDQIEVKPIGVYGSKESIVSLLSHLRVISEDEAQKLLQPSSTSKQGTLRPGLYLVRSTTYMKEHVFAIYYPEDSTWSTDPPSSVRRNRMTFMRYLSKIADQIVSLISASDAAGIVWKESKYSDDMDLEEDYSRLFSFEVAKTSEQEENVTSRPGFQFTCKNLGNLSSLPADLDESIFEPRFILGEMRQTLMNFSFKNATSKVEEIRGENFMSTRLFSLLRDAVTIKLEQTVTPDGITALIDAGLGKRCQKACKVYDEGLKSLKKRIAEERQIAEADALAEEKKSSAEVKSILERAALKHIISKFPTMTPEALVSAPIGFHMDNDPAFENLLSMFPEMRSEFDSKLGKLRPDIDHREFKRLKERIILTNVLLDGNSHIEGKDRQEILQTCLQEAEKRQERAEKEKGRSIISTVAHFIKVLANVKEDELKNLYPYSNEDKANFAKCDAMCSGTEHTGTASNPTQPSYCTMPIFHLPATTDQAVPMGYVSNDGHSFTCQNPAVLQQAFHVIFVIDRSGSMGGTDRYPLQGTPVTNKITRTANNRLGAVYSSLFAFWTSRTSALNSPQTRSSSGQTATPAARRDAYSVILFDHYVVNGGGTNYTAALQSTQAVLRQYWSTERTPVVIFLSDGECSVADETVRDLCRTSVALGKPLSFHTVAIGPSNAVLRRMAHIAREVQSSAPRDPLLPATASVESSHSEALDSVRLAQTFLGLADSLTKTRGSLIKGLGSKK